MEYCKFCNKECKNKISKAAHEGKCKLNPNRRDMSGKNNPRYGKEPLNKTIEEIENYKKDHVCCEICGKFDCVLCVDHDHNTNKFRGILCQSCNRFLGWFDNNKEKIKEYLKKKI